MNNPKSFEPIWSIDKLTSTNPKAGLVLTLTLVLILIASLLATALVYSARQSLTTVEEWKNYDNALFAAQTAAEKVKSNLHKGFADYHKSTYSWNNIYWIEDHAPDYSLDGTLSSFLTDANVQLDYSNAVISVVVSNGTVTGVFDARRVPITVTATATIGNKTRRIQEVFEYMLTKSTVFDYAYFMNNFGWMYGVNVNFNGDVRSNYDFDWRPNSRSRLNGCSITGPDSVNLNPHRVPIGETAIDYSASSRNGSSRPFYHPDATNATYTFDKGYDPNEGGTHLNGQARLDMPYIGDLNEYKDYARHENGTLSQAGSVLVDAVYDGVGPSGDAEASDNGTLVLIGTIANPIELNGPVVINGDVLIKGYYTGQGTIYAGRNMHVLDDIIAIDPPVWNYNDTADNFENHTLPDNLDRDFLGLCSKGNLTLGDYNDSYNRYIADTYADGDFVAPYPVSSFDADIGYAQYQEDGKWMFNGDYTAVFGEKSDGTPRKYYESSLSDDLFNALNPSAEISHVDALVYNNHLTTGTWRDGVINGGFICRDEAMAAKGKMHMNWDPRLGSDQDNGFRPFLPMKLAPSKTITWKEIAL